MNRLPSLLLAAALITACGEHSIRNVGYTGALTQAYDGGTYNPFADDGGLASIVIGPARLRNAEAMCGLPHGPVVEALAPQDLEYRVLGSWLLCDGEGNLAGFGPGISLADSSWMFLASDGDDGLQGAPAPDGEGMWNVGCATESGYQNDPCQPPGYAIDAAFFTQTAVGPNQTPLADGLITFEVSPTRFHLSLWTPEACAETDAGVCDLWFVPL